MWTERWQYCLFCGLTLAMNEAANSPNNDVLIAMSKMMLNYKKHLRDHKNCMTGEEFYKQLQYKWIERMFYL